MKKYIGILLVALLSLCGCDDNTDSLGMSILPDSDLISTNTKTFPLRTRSQLAGRVYARTSTGYVGRFTDPNRSNGFGDYEASFLTELNCTENFQFPDQYDDENHTGMMAGDTCVSFQLVVYYQTWFGDSLNACRMSAYKLNDKWIEAKDNATSGNKEFRYTDIDPTLYFTEDDLLGSKAYTAYDTSVPDSIRNATDSYGQSTFMPNIVFPLDKEWGTEIYRDNKAHPEKYANADAFIRNVLPGIYLKTDYGDGTILNVYRVDLQMQFRFHYLDDDGSKLVKKVTDDYGEAGSDSLYYSIATVFASTQEVVQANQFQNSALLEERVTQDTECTYLKSPAGIFTEVDLPLDNIRLQLAGDTLNAVKLALDNYANNTSNDFDMSAPTSVLLVRKQNKDSFFENHELPDNVTSFVATHNSVETNQYTFPNIARLVSTCLNEKETARQEAKAADGANWDESAWEEEWTKENPDWNKVLIIPVNVNYETNTSTGTQTMTGIEHDLQPTYAKLKGGEQGPELELEVTYTEFKQ